MGAIRPPHLPGCDVVEGAFGGQHVPEIGHGEGWRASALRVPGL
jgi:hypothetical protein